MKSDTAKLDLFLTHRTALIDYAAPIVGDRSRAEDVVQEAFIRFSGHDAQAGAPIVNPVSYLYRIVRNLAVDWARHFAFEHTAAEADSFDALPAERPSPEREALYRDELRLVSAALGELPARTRAAFEMRRLGDLTFQQIADRLGISIGLAHQLVRDAMTHCAERLGDLEP
jgi:RNA polymerase sigma-70 factor (ECF subfamily)